MKARLFQMGFDFRFKSDDRASDDFWNDYHWEEFLESHTVPLVGDKVNFWYIFKQFDHRPSTFGDFLQDYGTAVFEVISRELCPMKDKRRLEGSNSDNYDIILFYHLTLGPVEDTDLEYHLSEAKELLSAGPDRDG